MTVYNEVIQEPQLVYGGDHTKHLNINTNLVLPVLIDVVNDSQY